MDRGPQGSGGSTKSEIIQLEDIADGALKIPIDYCYNDHLDWAAAIQAPEGDDSSVIAEKLDALLDVLVAADRWLVADLHLDAHGQMVRGVRFFARSENVKQVQNIANEVTAGELKNYCEEYCIENAKAVLIANAGDE